MPLDRTIKRMHIIVKGMHEDVMRALQTKDITLAEDVLSRDNDVDRLHWLVARQYNILLQNANLAEKMNITIGMASTCFLISRIIERIGDHVVRIAQNVPTLIDSNLDRKIIDKISYSKLHFRLISLIKALVHFLKKTSKHQMKQLNLS